MGLIKTLGRYAWRKFALDGVSSSGFHKPEHPDIFAFIDKVDEVTAALSAAGSLKGEWDASSGVFPGAGATAKGDTWLVTEAGTTGGRFFAEGDRIVALVVNASTSVFGANWGVIPANARTVVAGVDEGAGTANAIQVTTEDAVVNGTVLVFPLFRSTTGSPVTVSVNGGPVLTVVTNRGNDVAALTSDMEIWGRVRSSDSTLRLLNDQDVSALVAQAEAARDEAVAAAASNVIRRVTSLAAAKELSSAVVKKVWIEDGGRSGWFSVYTSGYDDEIAADTAEGIFARMTDGGALVREGGWAVTGADVQWFGAVIDGTTDDEPAINPALSLGALVGFRVNQPRGISAVGDTIVLKNGAAWVGDNYLSTVKRLSGHSGALVKTENFDTLTGTSDAFAAGVPERVAIDEITFDGNYQNAARDAYVQSTGEGLRIFARKMKLNVRVFNTAGVGVWSECPGGNGPTPTQPGFSREADVCIYTHQTQYEGIVWKGPPDVKIGWILQADAGSRIVADQMNGKVNSPNYGAVNGGKCDGVVFDGRTGEIGEVHAFGNLGGGGIDWRNGGRINAGLLMAESCHYGGVSISGAAQGIVSKLDVHRTGGFDGDSTADFIYAGTGANNYGLEIGNLAVYRQDAANLGARNGVEITGDFLDVGVAKIDLGSTATNGHGLVIDNDTAQWINIQGGEIARCKGTAPDSLAASAVYRKTTGNGSLVNVKANVRDCDVAFRSVGTPRVETIDLQFFLNSGQSAFAGDVRTNAAQKWDIRGTINGAPKVSRFMGGSPAFDPTLTTKQTLTIAHGMIFAPPYGRYHATGIQDTGAAMTTGRVGFVQAISADDTNITVEVQMATANATNTAPVITVLAEI